MTLLPLPQVKTSPVIYDKEYYESDGEDGDNKESEI